LADLADDLVVADPTAVEVEVRRDAVHHDVEVRLADLVAGVVGVDEEQRNPPAEPAARPLQTVFQVGIDVRT